MATTKGTSQQTGQHFFLIMGRQALNLEERNRAFFILGVLIFYFLWRK